MPGPVPSTWTPPVLPESVGGHDISYLISSGVLPARSNLFHAHAADPDEDDPLGGRCLRCLFYFSWRGEMRFSPVHEPPGARTIRPASMPWVCKLIALGARVYGPMQTPRRSAGANRTHS